MPDTSSPVPALKPMNPGIKRRWVEALRSGGYAQGRLRLRWNRPQDDRDQFCCLGVLCDLAAQDGIVQWVPPQCVRDYYAVEENCSTLPDSVLDWAGLDDQPHLVYQRNKYPAFVLNDGGEETGDPLPFAEIADLIEAQL